MMEKELYDKKQAVRMKSNRVAGEFERGAAEYMTQVCMLALPG